MTQTEGATQAAHNKTVKTGIIASLALALLSTAALFYLIGPFAHAAPFEDRLTLAIQCAILPGFMLLAGIITLGKGRFGNKAEDPTACEASSQAMKVNIRYLSNTHEQFSLFIINILALALLLPAPALTLLPIYAGLFVVGRIAFWIGYHLNPLHRATGFGLTFYPSVAAMLYNVFAVLAGLV